MKYSDFHEKMENRPIGVWKKDPDLCVQKVVGKQMLKYHRFLYYICDLGCLGNRRVPESLVPIIDFVFQK